MLVLTLLVALVLVIVLLVVIMVLEALVLVVLVGNYGGVDHGNGVGYVGVRGGLGGASVGVGDVGVRVVLGVGHG